MAFISNIYIVFIYLIVEIQFYGFSLFNFKILLSVFQTLQFMVTGRTVTALLLIV